jgi:hypothetical protein
MMLVRELGYMSLMLLNGVSCLNGIFVSSFLLENR